MNILSRVYNNAIIISLFLWTSLQCGFEQSKHSVKNEPSKDNYEMVPQIEQRRIIIHKNSPPTTNPFKTNQKLSQELSDEICKRRVLQLTAFIKKLCLSFYHADEYHLEIATKRRLISLSQCPYKPKSDFYKKIVRPYASSSISEDTYLLVVTIVKRTVFSELRKICIPLNLAYKTRFNLITCTYNDIMNAPYKWDKNQHKWEVKVSNFGTLYIPLDYMTTDQELINREDYSKIYFTRDVWKQKLEDLLFTYDQYAKQKDELKWIEMTPYCCYGQCRLSKQ